MALNTNGSEQPKRQFRGFAAMSPELRRKLQSRGGKHCAKKRGKAHMSRIGKRGRKIRTQNERRARQAA